MQVPLLFPRARFLALLNKAKDLECSYRDSKAFQIKALLSLLPTEITGCLSCPFPSLCHPPRVQLLCHSSPSFHQCLDT